MSATASDTDFFYGYAAARTGPVLTTKNPGKSKVTSPLAFGIDVIFVCRTTFFNAQVHDVFDFLGQQTLFVALKCF